MFKEKHRIIKKEGSVVDIIRHDGSIIKDVCALIGRATKSFDNSITLESNRRGHFISTEYPLDNGFVCYDRKLDAYYLMVAVYHEILEGNLATYASHMLKTNSTITVYGYTEDADEDGNITKQKTLKYVDVKVFTRSRDLDLKRTEPGIREHNEYNIFAPNIQVNSLDHVVLSAGNLEYDFKVISADYISFSGLVILTLESETRR